MPTVCTTLPCLKPSSECTRNSNALFPSRPMERWSSNSGLRFRDSGRKTWRQRKKRFSAISQTHALLAAGRKSYCEGAFVWSLVDAWSLQVKHFNLSFVFLAFVHFSNWENLDTLCVRIQTTWCSACYVVSSRSCLQEFGISHWLRPIGYFPLVLIQWAIKNTTLVVLYDILKLESSSPIPNNYDAKLILGRHSPLARLSRRKNQLSVTRLSLLILFEAGRYHSYFSLNRRIQQKSIMWVNSMFVILSRAYI